jgi:nitroreductase
MKDPASIFTEVPEFNNHHEVIRDTSPEEFDKIVQNRRSVRYYTNEKIPRHVLDQVLEWALLAPNSSNLQSWEFFVVQDPIKKSKLVEALFNQPAARTAQELIVAVAKLKTWKSTRQQMLDHLAKQENAPKSALAYYKKLVPLVYTQGPLSSFGMAKRMVNSVVGVFRAIPREPYSRSDMRVWSVKSTALACQNIMMGFSAHGFDTCPMEGYDSRRIKRILNLGRDSEVVMVISAGKRDKRGVYGPRIRMAKEQFLKFI